MEQKKVGKQIFLLISWARLEKMAQFLYVIPVCFSCYLIILDFAHFR